MPDNDTRLYPCDLCTQSAGSSAGVSCGDCALFAIPDNYACARSDCRLNDNGKCTIGLYECCGAWRNPNET